MARGASAQLIGPDRLEVAGATGEEVGTLAAERAIPIFETATEAADLEGIFLRLIAAGANTDGATGAIKEVAR